MSAAHKLTLVGPDATMDELSETPCMVTEDAEIDVTSSWRSIAEEIGLDGNLDEPDLSAAFLSVLHAAEEDAARFQTAFIRASRQAAKLEREVALLHEAGVKLRYERAELLVERDLLRERLLAAAVKRRELRMVEVARQQNNNATWRRRAWAWVGIRLGVML